MCSANILCGGVAGPVSGCCCVPCANVSDSFCTLFSTGLVKLGCKLTWTYFLVMQERRALLMNTSQMGTLGVKVPLNPLAQYVDACGLTYDLAGAAMAAWC